MQALMPLPSQDEAISDVSIPDELSTISPRIGSFFQSVATASQSMLLLDFDGTLAPFRVDPTKVRPWAGVVEQLRRIQDTGRTRVAIVSGRPAQDVSLLLDLHRHVEIWGLHGAERLLPDGEMERQELRPEEQEALAAARDRVHSARLGLALRVEEKWNSVAFHWRGKSPHSVQLARERTYELLRPFADAAGMQLLQFDGGIELRAGRNKGDAVRFLLNGLGGDTPVAYLGDDTTDEDAFNALVHRGLGVLVRREWRPTAAHVWLRPPGQLRSFLATWLRMLQ